MCSALSRPPRITAVVWLPAAPLAVQVRSLIQRDMRPTPGSDQHVEVDYGYLTGMGL